MITWKLTLQVVLVTLVAQNASAFITTSIPGSDIQRIETKYQSALPPTSTHSSSLLLSTKDTEAPTVDSDEKQPQGVLMEVPTYKLIKAIGRNPENAAQEILEELSKLRQNNPTSAMEPVLNALLETTCDQKLPFWTRLRPLTRFSERARLRSLRQTLDLTTPPPSTGESANSMLQRRRRALVALVRQLADLETNDNDSGKQKVPAIVTLEKKARLATKETNASDLRTRLPEGLETPSYQILDQLENGKGGQMEIRQYDSYSVCAVPMNKPRPSNDKTDAKVQMPEMSGASSFGALAGYLFGKNTEEKAMSMTTPVFTTTNPSDSGDGEKQMEFVLPSDYWKDTATAPQPLKESGVTLQQVEGNARAVLMFGGYATPKEVEKRKQQLQKSLNSNKKWNVVPNQSAQLAQYNDPFTVPWRRLNEVSLAVEAVDANEQS